MRTHRRGVRPGPGPSSTLITPDRAGNVVGVDPHKRTLTATIVDPRGGIVAWEHFRVSGDGHRALEAWARQFGAIARVGVEGASAWGRHTAIFLAARGYDVRDVCPNRTARHDRARQRGKSDMLDAERIARETLAHPLLPRAFKRAGQDHGPDQHAELLAVWWGARCSLIKRRQHLLTEVEALLRELPLALIESLPDTERVRPRLVALARLTRRRRFDPPTMVRLTVLGSYRVEIAKLDAEEKQIRSELARLIQASGSTLEELCGLSTVSVAELLVETGDPRRFTIGGFGRFNGTAPLAASTAEGPGEPIRHRYNPGGNRRVNAILYRMALTQLRCEPRAKTIYANARANGHTKKEARRILKRHLSDVVYRRMIRDLEAQLTRPAPPGRVTVRGRRAVKSGPTGPSAASCNAAPLTAIAGHAPPSRQEGTLT
ncbi:MAG: transposase [Solirubrobacterales bacterium]|nr:transposase [Solirubrobacterales bacterium]MBV8990419.1 transposase [Solirubrobacterales bacterium]MBV9050030.1 transposase [Solirubrobacterales bacterium]MBV9799542.1 transposase [Solirubrobacterales bacterium]